MYQVVQEMAVTSEFELATLLLCYDHAHEGVGLLFLFTASLFPVLLPRTLRNILRQSTYLRYDSHSRPFQYDVG